MSDYLIKPFLSPTGNQMRKKSRMVMVKAGVFADMFMYALPCFVLCKRWHSINTKTKTKENFVKRKETGMLNPSLTEILKKRDERIGIETTREYM